MEPPIDRSIRFSEGGTPGWGRRWIYLERRNLDIWTVTLSEILCNNKLKLKRAVFFEETDETIRMFECDCGERIWDE